jgi:hypothetical protein
MKFSELIDLINTYQSLERMKGDLEDKLFWFSPITANISKESLQEQLKITIQKLEEMREGEI